MNALISSYENRLRNGAEILQKMETLGRRDARYHQTLRRWIELLAAYEYESEMDEAGLAAVGLATAI